ncbi:natural resistance-associated macrophage protein [Nadsonia fulvescens var. elongata DSM 6958]|uniref:Natural resistance-associated macrophage protein n=1 Tax=Nadsonia fulvescens var. elongata DSM 6958 TaxID=857566 RepID=A0A1E3PJH8_9ASCO|nr:natural resistance-associated macrophage protein [Nadsonia fulvescens var. elongata DSM 6958]
MISKAIDASIGLPQMGSNVSSADKSQHGLVYRGACTIRAALAKYSRFVGPGLMVAVAYMDPGNYSTGVAAGAKHKYGLLFVVLFSNILAIWLQALAIQLGSVTGRDLATNCRDYFPKWLSIFLYIMAEIAIIATDLAEVIGTAIALNILIKVPLMAGVILTILDVLVVLLAYRPGGSIKYVRWFEYTVAALVLGVVVCFCVLLARVPTMNAGEVFRGYLPSNVIFKGSALYDACGILGATVMPHSLFLGSGLVQPRLREFDILNGYYQLPTDASDQDESKENDTRVVEQEVDPNVPSSVTRWMMAGSVCDKVKSLFAFNKAPNGLDMDDLLSQYRPSVSAIKHCLNYSIAELAFTLFSFALFVNSAILIVSAATLSDSPNAADADLYSIHSLMKSHISAAAGTIFMLALLLSGQSAGIVCTIAGQMVSEGFLNWTFRPWIRRLITRGIAILPCIVVTAAVGQSGLSQVLNISQVILSILLPFLTAPLVYMICNKRIMTVQVIQEPEQLETTGESAGEEFLMQERENFAQSEDALVSGENSDSNSIASSMSNHEARITHKDMSNHWAINVFSIMIWVFITILNVYLIVRLGMGDF